MSWLSDVFGSGGSSIITGGLSGVPIIGEVFSGAQQAAMSNRDLQAQQDMFNRNLASQEKWNQINYDWSREQFDYAKGLQNQMFSREDDAVQRRVSDLRKAGLSPTLAAGQAAGAGAVVPTSAPRGDAPQGQAARRQLFKTKMADMADVVQLATLGAHLDNIKAQTRRLEADAAVDEHDLSYAERAGMGVRTHGNTIKDAVNAILDLMQGKGVPGQVGKEVNKSIKDIIDTINESVKDDPDDGPVRRWIKKQLR